MRLNFFKEKKKSLFLTTFSEEINILYCNLEIYVFVFMYMYMHATQSEVDSYQGNPGLTFRKVITKWKKYKAKI